MIISKETARRLSLSEKTVQNVLEMASDGATVPFMARYRKERTGNLDEVILAEILKTASALEDLEKRRAFILKSIADQGKLDERLKAQIEAAADGGVLEDLYLPYKPKRRTRGMAAEEKGLKALADLILADTRPGSIEKERFFGAEDQAADWEEALHGASDILADRLNEDASVRSGLRSLFKNKAVIGCKAIKGREEEGIKYRDYFDRKEWAARAPSHRVLAMFRAADEGFLRLKIRPEEEQGVAVVHKSSPFRMNNWRSFQDSLEKDSYKRLLAPSLETENRKVLKEKADAEAIRVFASNLRVLLMEAPLGQCATLAVDPGLRTGCKIVCLSPQGDLLHDTVIYPLEPHNKSGEAERTIKALVEKYSIRAVAVGNGTGGREARSFCASLECMKDIPVVMVNESGASIYSASEVARKEFPDYDLTVRGAVSIGRRLMDPLAELVKLDPSSIGVGQYQHDVDQKALHAALDEVVISCVNTVGVELNTASEQLLSYVSGMSARTAAAVVAHRNEHGPFRSREELKNVKGIGAKCFEQASGFLRIRDGQNPLDNTAIHPEQYDFVAALCRALKLDIGDIIGRPETLKNLSLREWQDKDRGAETIRDIIAEISQPGRDPREEFKSFDFDDSVKTMDDLEEGMVLPGVISNVTAFGAFVDLGVHQDGLIHISQMADRYISDPADVVKPSQKLKVRILEVDRKRNRISCSLKGVDQG